MSLGNLREMGWGEQFKLKIPRLVVDRETDVEEKDKEDLTRKGEKIERKGTKWLKERRGLQRRMRQEEDGRRLKEEHICLFHLHCLTLSTSLELLCLNYFGSIQVLYKHVFSNNGSSP